MEPTSEQELRQLLDEGRITEDEYHELKQAMAEKEKFQSPQQEQGENRSDSIYNLGKTALLLALGGTFLPVVGYLLIGILAGPGGGADIEPWIFLFYAMEIAGLVIGSISWKSGFGKAAAITAGVLILLSVNFIA